MSVTFTKLFSSITASTIWCESSDTRVVWITMLAMSDRYGRVWASIPGLAKEAAVSVEACRAAVHAFLSPDPDSRTKVAEGRRIEPIDGGWKLINHAKYRAIRDEEERRAYKTEKQRQYRSVDNLVDNVDKSGPKLNGVDAGGHNAEADTDTDADTKKEQKPSPKPRKRVSEGRKKKELTARPTKTDFDKARHREFKTAVFEYWQSKNSIDCPWGQPEGMQLEIWLKANPTIVIGEFKAILRNRYKSDVVHSERPSKWLRNATDYANGPLNQYNKPMTNGKNGGFLGKGDRNIAALNEALSGSGFSVDQNSTGTDGDSEGGDGGRFDFKSLLSAPGQRTT